MSSSTLLHNFHRLDLKSRHILQICAVNGGPFKNDELLEMSQQLEWKDGRGKRLLKSDIARLTKELEKRQLLGNSYYYGFHIDPEIQDLAVQDAIQAKTFSQLADLAVKKVTSRYAAGDSMQRDLRIAFYRNEVAKCRELLRGKSTREMVPVLEPFNREIFDGLDPELMQLYMVNAVPRYISDPNGGAEALQAFLDFSSVEKSDNADFQAAQLDYAVAAGDLNMLRILDDHTRRKLPEVEGCLAFLEGRFDEAEASLATVMPGGKRRSKVNAIGHLPAVLYVLLQFRKSSPVAMAKACGVVSAISKSRKGHFGKLIDVISEAIQFVEAPSSPSAFVTLLNGSLLCGLPVLLAGYFRQWLVTDEDTPLRIANLPETAAEFEQAGLKWLAAECCGVAGCSNLKSAEKYATRARDLHKELKTSSLVGLAKAEPVWQRSLNAIAALTGGDEASPAATTSDEQQERLIWELNPRRSRLSMEVFRQKRTAKGWSKGRKVALVRLHEQSGDAQFAFLTDQDRQLCSSIEVESYRERYGIETYASVDNARMARALIGHPGVFAPGDRENPFEIVEHQPKLIVAKDKKGGITLKLDPPLPKPLHDDGRLEYSLVSDGPQRVAVVFFTAQHQRLDSILNGKLRVPEFAAGQVVEAIQPVASIIAVHSEIAAGKSSQKGKKSGATTTVSEAVKADPRPHIHLLPYQEGLRAEFFVRPFGEDGPFCQPGQGAENVFAAIDGKSKTTQRNLTAERDAQEAVFEACRGLAAYAVEDGVVCLPTPLEALETLIQLEELVEAKSVVLHWPQGRRLELAGSAGEAQLKVQIRKDRDWFAASGSLNVDKSLAIDMLDLVDMVRATPSRFVQLSDGRFLALTEQLRRRIEDFAAYGDRRARQNKFRFPRVRANVLEDLGNAVTLKADKHWTEWVDRVRTAGDVTADIPSTLQVELRDYQLEGFRWLTRLAAWGAGACLADDMGLGKTIQALALLVHRSSDGPALVVAPTSVAFNWLNEARNFAPTLNARIFGDGNRDDALQDLGSRDVVICSYGLLHTEAKRLQKQAWHTVVLDEAQAIKNMATQRSKAAMKLEAEFRIIMTGTPLENHLGELWNLMEFINPGLLGSADAFQKRFAQPIERDGCRETKRRLKKLIQPFILRRTKSQVLQDLPSRTEITLQVQLSTEEAALYEALRQRAVEQLSESDAEGPQHLKILAELMKLRRACCHPSLAMADCDIPGSKLALFSETLEELLDNNHKVLVFSQFVDHLAILRSELESKNIAYQYLDGSTPAKQRKKSVEAFQAGEGDVFLISLKAGGLGLNLTAADYVIHMDPWWNPAVEDQASDRAHRMGQQRPVTIYRLITAGTIEEKIMDLHAGKRDLADSLLEGTDASGKLSADELLKLIRE